MSENSAATPPSTAPMVAMEIDVWIIEKKENHGGKQNIPQGERKGEERINGNETGDRLCKVMEHDDTSFI